MSKLKTIILALLFLMILVPQSTSASSHCTRDDVVRGTSPEDLHRYTGSDCSAIRTLPGSIIGPGQFGDSNYFRCLGACKYEVNYCTSDGCEAVFPQGGPNQCDTAPPKCQNPNTATSSNIGNVFGKIIPPDAIIDFGFGARGIGTFFSNLIALIYIIAAIVLIFMILWGAFDWMTSEGDKEKLQGAQKKLINAFIGILLFAVAFGIIRVLGIFTGFTFFTGQ